MTENLHIGERLTPEQQARKEEIRALVREVESGLRIDFGRPEFPGYYGERSKEQQDAFDNQCARYIKLTGIPLQEKNNALWQMSERAAIGSYLNMGGYGRSVVLQGMQVGQMETLQRMAYAFSQREQEAITRYIHTEQPPEEMSVDNPES